MKFSKKDFDNSIKKTFLSEKPVFNNYYLSEESDYGGLNQNGHEDNLYFSVEHCNEIVQLLDKNILQSLLKGKGSEIKSGKFFSVASSCRYAIANFTKKCNKKLVPIQNFSDRKCEKIDFEHECIIPGIKGTAPQIDVFIDCHDMQIYFEVKCHEIFDTSEHKNSLKKLSQQYRTNRIFGIFPGINQSESLSLEDFGIAVNSYHFDFKQFLCHLMGIISNKSSNKATLFYYLFYKPTDIENAYLKEIYDNLENEIRFIAEKFTPVFAENNIEFGYVYNDVFDTLSDAKWKTRTILFAPEEH